MPGNPTKKISYIENPAVGVRNNNDSLNGSSTGAECSLAGYRRRRLGCRVCGRTGDEIKCNRGPVTLLGFFHQRAVFPSVAAYSPFRRYEHMISLDLELNALDGMGRSKEAQPLIIQGRPFRLVDHAWSGRTLDQFLAICDADLRADDGCPAGDDDKVQWRRRRRIGARRREGDGPCIRRAHGKAKSKQGR